MAPILTARGSGVFPPADPTVVRGNTVPVPGCSSVSDCRSVLTAAGFRHTTVRTDSGKAAGALVGTSPPRGGRAVVGQLVSILVSNGSDYEPEPKPEPVPVPEPIPEPEPTPVPTPGADPPLPGRPPPDAPGQGDGLGTASWPRPHRGGG
jgi:beta-lactam-binding protein with PASTA domain